MLKPPKKNLAPEEVNNIRQAYYTLNKNLNTLSKEYNLSVSMIHKIVSYRAYKEVPDSPAISDDLKQKQRQGKRGVGEKKAFKAEILRMQAEAYNKNREKNYIKSKGLFVIEERK